MNRPRTISTVLAGTLLLSAAPLARHAAQDDAPPRKSTLVERTGARLVQLDVTLSGPAKSLENLTAEDFTLKVGGRIIESFEVDRLCRAPVDVDGPARPAETPEIEQPAEVAPLAQPALGPTTFLFYFDQPHLTMAGRAQAMDTVRDLIPQLITGGNRGMIVSSARGLKTIADLTTDPQELLDAVDLLENDQTQWDMFAQQEQKRWTEVLEALNEDISRASGVAKMHHDEELWRAERDMRRLSMVMGQLASHDPPKVVIYLADNMRQNAGEHYLMVFGADKRAEIMGQTGFFGAQGSFHQVVNQASALGIRLYTVLAQGLTSVSMPTSSRSGISQQIGGRDYVNALGSGRVKDAEDLMHGFALETGGRAFVRGQRPAKIAGTILDDLSCLYLISFDPGNFVQDQPLPVGVQVHRPKVKAQVRGRVVVQSETTRLTSRLLAAFASPEAVSTSESSLHATVIPTGYQDGEYSAIVQVAAPGSEIPGTSWDLGASIVVRGKTRETSGRMTVNAADAPVILQNTLRFPPGPFEIVAVAHNVTTDTVASAQIEGRWPKPNAELAAVGPIGVLQPTLGAILKDDEVRTSGAVALDRDEPIRTDRPTALVATVCKSRDQKGVLRVERSLVGETAVDFPLTEMDLGKESCALIQDVIPAKTMTAGSFRYRVRILFGEEELAAGERRFVALEPSS